ncbi:MAG: flagellar biosynthetic protein FliO [Thiohalomonadaceae bacterium]
MKLLRILLSGLFGCCCQLPAMAADIGRPTPATVEPITTTILLQVLLALGLILLLIVGLAWLLRRVGGFAQHNTGLIRVLGGVSVGQRERVVLIQVGQRQLLLGVAPGRIETLHVLDEPINAQNGHSQDESFAERLQTILKKGRRA